MLRSVLAAALLAAAPLAAFADEWVDAPSPNRQFLPVYPTGQGGFLVGRRNGIGPSDYFCRAGQWARRQGAAYTDRVEVVRGAGDGVSFRILSGGRSSGGIFLRGRAGEARSVGHALALCD